jgi:hypothetical protein
LSAPSPAQKLILQCGVNELCKRRPLYWLQNWTKTFDEHWKEKGCTPYNFFPRLPYFEWLFSLFQSERRLFVPKSREMMTSWCVIAYAVWLCQWNERTHVIVQAQREGKVIDLVAGKQTAGYARTLYEQQPPFLRGMHPMTKPSEEMPGLELAWENGSRLQGVPKGADQLRQYHPTLVIFDEAAHLDEFQSAYGNADLVSTQVIAVSSAGPSWFGDVCERSST